MRDLPPLSRKIERLRCLETSSILFIRKASQGISHRKGRLGIFPASFNPPTKAHLALIRRAKRVRGLDEILVLLDAGAMDKEIIGAGLEDRVIMLQRLFQREQAVSIGISNRGLFIEKLHPLRRAYPSGVEFTFIVGFDTILRVMDRRYYETPESSLDTLFTASSFLVANRGEKDSVLFETLFEDAGNRKYEDKISLFVLPDRFSVISSSLVRERLGEGKPAGDLVPLPVLRFIEEKGLYAERELFGTGRKGLADPPR